MPITVKNNQNKLVVQGTGLKEEAKKVTVTATALTQTAGGDISHADGTQGSGDSAGYGVLTVTHFLTSLELATGGNDDATFYLELEEQSGQTEFALTHAKDYTITCLVFDSSNVLIEQLSKLEHQFLSAPSASNLGTVEVSTGSQSITVTAENCNNNVSNVIISVTALQASDDAVKHWVKSYSKAEIINGVTITGTTANNDKGINDTEFVGGIKDGSKAKIVVTPMNSSGTAADTENSTYVATPSTTANKTSQVQVTAGKTLLTNGAASIAAADIVSGSVYKIATAGNSDFAAHVGAANNDVGTVFTASADGSANLTGTTGTVTSLASVFSSSIGPTSDGTLVISAKQGAQLPEHLDLHYMLRATKDGTTYYKKYAKADSNASDGYVRFLISSAELVMYTDSSGEGSTSTTVSFADGLEYAFNIGSINQITIDNSADPSYADANATGKASGLPAQVDGLSSPIGMAFAVGSALAIATGSSGSTAAIAYVNQASWGQKIRISLKAPDSNGSDILGFKFTVGGATLTKALTDLTTEAVNGSDIDGFYSYIATNGIDGVTLVNGTTYAVSNIRAYNANGDSTSNSSLNNLIPSTKPGVPTSVFGSPKTGVKAADSSMHGKVKGDWVAPGDNGGSAITSYVYKLIKNDDNSVVSTGDSDVTTFTWTADGSSIVLGTGYRITVAAKNANGQSTNVTAVVSSGDNWDIFAPSQPPALAASSGVAFASGISNTFLDDANNSFFTVTLGNIAADTVATNGGYTLTSYIIEMVDIDGNGTKSKTVNEGSEGNAVVFNGAEKLVIANSQYKYKMAVYPVNAVYSTKADSTAMFATLTSGGAALEIEMSDTVLSLSSAVTQDTSASSDGQLTFQWTLNSGAQYTSLTGQTVKVDYDRPVRAANSMDITFPGTFDQVTNFTGTIDASNAPTYKATFTGLDNGWKYKCSVIPNSQQRQKSDLANLAAVTSPAATLSGETIPATKPGLTLGSATGGSSEITVLNNGSALDTCILLVPYNSATAVRDISSSFLIGGDASVKFKVGGQDTVPGFNRFYYAFNGSLVNVSYKQTISQIPTATIDGVANTNNMLVLADNGKGATVALNGAPLSLSVS
jgi:hypothetical protein